tara:strand:+ start:1252 stop:1428 length:177 start_codon:yes stop_codon:yes gene_type:complete
MEREKNYIKIEYQYFHETLNEVRDEILYEMPLYKIVIARVKRFMWTLKCRRLVKVLTK